MDFLELVSIRHSVRKYDGRPVEREKIERCAQAARLAPSACNSQPWKFIIADDPELKAKAAKYASGGAAAINRFAAEAPVIAAVVMEKPNYKSRLGASLKDIQYNYIDMGIAVEHFCLQAAEEGLGTCILGWFDEKGIKKVLSIPENKKVGLLITMGYPRDGGSSVAKRKSIDEMRSYNKY
jgi:nitroreductase